MKLGRTTARMSGSTRYSQSGFRPVSRPVVRFCAVRRVGPLGGKQGGTDGDVSGMGDRRYVWCVIVRWRPTDGPTRLSGKLGRDGSGGVPFRSVPFRSVPFRSVPSPLPLGRSDIESFRFAFRIMPYRRIADPSPRSPCRAAGRDATRLGSRMIRRYLVFRAVVLGGTPVHRIRPSRPSPRFTRVARAWRYGRFRHAVRDIVSIAVGPFRIPTRRHARREARNRLS